MEEGWFENLVFYYCKLAILQFFIKGDHGNQIGTSLLTPKIHMLGSHHGDSDLACQWDDKFNFKSLPYDSVL